MKSPAGAGQCKTSMKGLRRKAAANQAAQAAVSQASHTRQLVEEREALIKLQRFRQQSQGLQRGRDWDLSRPDSLRIDLPARSPLLSYAFVVAGNHLWSELSSGSLLTALGRLVSGAEVKILFNNKGLSAILCHDQKSLLEACPHHTAIAYRCGLWALLCLKMGIHLPGEASVSQGAHQRHSQQPIIVLFIMDCIKVVSHPLL